MMYNGGKILEFKSHIRSSELVDTDNLSPQELMSEFGFGFSSLKHMAEQSQRYTAMLEAVDRINLEMTPDQYLLAEINSQTRSTFEFYRSDKTGSLNKYWTTTITGGSYTDFIGNRLLVKDDEVFLQNDTIDLALKLETNASIYNKPNTIIYQSKSDKQTQNDKYYFSLWFQDLIGQTSKWRPEKIGISSDMFGSQLESSKIVAN